MKLSVGTQLAIVIVSVLLFVTTLLVVVLASQERHETLESKQAAATMVTNLFASSVAAGVVFKDNDAVKAMLENLRATDDVVGAAVFEIDTNSTDAEAATLLTRVSKPHVNPVAIGSFGEKITSFSDQPVEIGGDRLVVTHTIVDSEAKVVGIVRVVFSLGREYKAVAHTQRQLIFGGLTVMLFTAALLIGFTRFRVVQPLMRLVQTAKDIEEGELSARAPERGNVEIATLARAFNSMGTAIADRDRRLRGELQVAADLQLSILPKLVTTNTKTTNPALGIEMAAVMKPATEVGGDYYDIIPTKDGCWLGIGDVSGHGLGSGVIMLMIQASIAALVSSNPDLSPTDVECAVNRVLYENIRKRMGRRDHATLSVLRYWNDGRVRFAGAHEDIIVYRAKTGLVETFETPGTWVGAKKDVRSATIESAFSLEPCDVLVLYTDGVTEARAPNGELFGFDRLVHAVRAKAASFGKGSSASADAIRDAVLASINLWMFVGKGARGEHDDDDDDDDDDDHGVVVRDSIMRTTLHDDISIVVLRQRTPA